MLVITRKHNQSFHIGDNITVRIVDISRSCVRIGIDAPKDMDIYRSELRAYTETKPATQIRETEHD